MCHISEKRRTDVLYFGRGEQTSTERDGSSSSCHLGFSNKHHNNPRRPHPFASTCPSSSATLLQSMWPFYKSGASAVIIIPTTPPNSFSQQNDSELCHVSKASAGRVRSRWRRGKCELQAKPMGDKISYRKIE